MFKAYLRTKVKLQNIIKVKIELDVIPGAIHDKFKNI